MAELSLNLGQLLERMEREPERMVVAPNARAAGALRAAFDRRQRLAGRRTWAPANVLSWMQWLSKMWTAVVLEGLDDRLLLNGAQEHLVWREIIAADQATSVLTPVDALAGLAASAWKLAAEYRALGKVGATAGTQDARVFAGWAEEFARKCGRDRLLAGAELEAALERHVMEEGSGFRAQGPGVLLCGFGEMTPTQRGLLGALVEAGVGVEWIVLRAEGGRDSWQKAWSLRGAAKGLAGPSTAPSDEARSASLRMTESLTPRETDEAFADPRTASLGRTGSSLDGETGPFGMSVVCADERAEMRFAVGWLREFVETHEGARVALLVPELGQERAELEPVLRELLAPELEDVAADLSSTPWEMSASAPLGDMPLVSLLLDAARWMRGALPIETVSAVVLAPYFTTGLDADARARFDAGVLQRQLLLRPEMEMRTVLVLARKDGVWPELAAWLGGLYELGMEMAAAPPRRTYADWTEWFRLLARTVGWPGARMLTAREQAAVEAFDAVLDLLATLDFAGKRVTFAEALEALERQAVQTAAPSVVVDAAIQVMTPAEAEGQVFDAVVFARATDANLPARVRTNPLLDWGLQKNFAMPGGDAERDYAAAMARLERLLASAGTALFTSAEMSESGALRGSALVRGFARCEKAAEEAAEPLVEMEVVEDATALPPLPSAEIRGGSRLLKLQAACGFLAFAELRLGGREPESHDAGFDAIESGNVLHRALEAFWKETQTQQRLREMSEAQKTEALERAIDGAISRKLTVVNAWDRAYVDVQKQRMLTVLRRWMEFELERGPFTVLDSEREEMIAVGPLQLTVRMDRIDAVPDGKGGTGVVFVDYKTGAAAKPKSWEGERPEEPQLPLYALAGDASELQGLAFAKVRAGSGMEWTGLAAGEEVLPKKGSKVVDLTEYAETWRGVLDRLAEDFANGASHVEPKSYAVNCKRCAQRLLCRLNVAELMEQPGDEDDAEAAGE